MNNHDPLAVLHGGELPVQPDPAFAARLRARLESALSLPDRTQEVVMSGTDTAIAELSDQAAGSPPAPSRPAAAPYLTVANAREAIDWYVEALGATVLGNPVEMADGRIGHAELMIGDGVLYLADEYPEIGLKAPVPQFVSVSLLLQVQDTDATLRRCRERGATVPREAYENYGARNATLVDPFGHRWMLSGPVTGAATPIQHGDVAYVSVWAPDADRAAAFYGHVLGWTIDPATHEVTNTGQRIGIHSLSGRQGMSCWYAVADLDGARESILAAGGTVGEAREHPVGTVLDAVDPAGTAFAVLLPTVGTPRPALNGEGPGELSYISYQVRDSAAFRAFYSQLLFWSFEPGRVEDGWAVQDTHPMAGVAGGSAQPVVVPMWTVADVDAAVARVREAGGTVIDEPSQQSYGMSALCTDDQGTRFYLGQF